MFLPNLVRSFARLNCSVFVRLFAWLGFFLVGFFSFFQVAYAQESLSYQTGTVTEIVSEQQLPEADAPLFIQEVQVRLEDGSVIPLAVGSEFQPLTAQQRLQVGRQVVVARQVNESGDPDYVLADVYRLPVLLFVALGLFVLVVWVGRKRGLFAVIGMLLSVMVLVKVIIPLLLAGYDPVLVALTGSIAIAAATIYLSHGVGLKSHLAFGSLVVVLLAVGLLSLSTVRAAQLVGLGSEEAYFLQFGPTAQINLQGLLLAGILLGALGVLDDIVVSQVSVVHELKAVSPGLSFEELYQRGLEVGRDHVASLVNTLVLAYAGANLPLFLLFYLNTQSPFWVTLNSDIIAEEVLRTLVGSVALVTAVPVATALAAWVYTRQEADEPALKSVSGSGKKKSTMRHRH